MQTFLPFASFAQSAKVLDGSRLRKQQTEAEQILKTLRKGPSVCTECGDPFSYGCCGGHGKPKTTPWYNHPAVLQWEGYDRALELYIYAISEECKARGFKGRTATYPALLVMPPWLSKEEVHASHRSRLMFKGRVDAVCEVLKKDLKVRSINAWLLSCNYPSKNMTKLEDVIRLEDIAKTRNLQIPPNYYKQFNWSEPDNIPYVWPVQKKTASN